MNPVLKGVLKSLEQVAAATVPGGLVIDSAVHNIIDHKNIEAEIPDLAQAIIQAVEAIKDDEIADESKFHAGVQMLDAGFKLIVDALKHKSS